MALNSWGSVNSWGPTHRALIIGVAGSLRQITDAELGTGKKPLVLVDGTIKERVAREGIPLVYDQTLACLRTLAINETLQI